MRLLTFPRLGDLNFGVLDNFEPTEPLIRLPALQQRAKQSCQRPHFFPTWPPERMGGLAKLSNHFARLIAAPGPLDPGGVFDTLKLTDARRRPDRFTRLLLIAGSIHNHGPSWTPLAEQWNRALEALLMPIETSSLEQAQIDPHKSKRCSEAESLTQ